MRLLTSLVSTVALLAACGDAAGPEREISGERMFARYCARCHGLDGKGTTQAPNAKDLTHRPTIDRLGEAGIRRVIMMGHAPEMPGFFGQFTEASLAVLIAHVRSLPSSSKSPEGLPRSPHGSKAP